MGLSDRVVWEDDKASASNPDSQRKLRGLCSDVDLLTMQTYFRGCSDSFVRQADISLLTEGQEFPTHSQLISAFSSVFADMFDSCSIPKGETRHSIELEDPADQLLAFLSFVYRSVTKENRAIQCREEAAALASIAHKYNAERASRAAEHFLVSQAPRMTLQDAVDWAILADTFDLPLLLTKAQLYLMDHFREIDDGLIKRLTGSLSSHSIMTLARGFAYAWDASTVVCSCGYRTPRYLSGEPHNRLGFVDLCQEDTWVTLAPLPDARMLEEWLEKGQPSR